MALDNPSYFTVEGQQQHHHHPQAMGTASKDVFVNNPSDCCPLTNTNQIGAIRRALLRSVSTNSADSNQELLVLGEPRLSDMAPEMVVMNAARSSGEPRRSNSLKTKGEMHGSRYTAVPTDEDDVVIDTDDDEEIFLTNETAKYYNTSAVNGRRRHSIGTFVMQARDRSSVASSKSFKDDRNQTFDADAIDNDAAGGLGVIDEHSLRHASYPRKRCLRCTGGTIKKNSDMDDILIVYFKNSEIVKLWVDYISSYFKQPEERPIYRKPFKVQHLGIEDIVDANGDIRYIAERTAGVKLQLVIICPNFLEQLSSNPNPASALGKILLPDRTLALLLGVTEDDVKDEHKIVFPHYSQWQRSAVGQDQDESFTKEFLTTAMGILLKVWKQQSSIINQEKALFSVSPKKIRQGQSAFIIMLTYPLQKEDVIKISIERNNELTEIKSVKRRNPYTLKVIVPDVLTEISAIVHVLVEKNGTIIGMRPIKCESRLRELEQILRSVTSPVEFMCQTLGFNPQNKEQLDNYLVHALQKNLPPNFNLLNNHTNINFNHHDHKFGMTKEFPTLLHFAAKFGLEKLAMQLLDCPGGDVACEIRNSNEMIPAEIASDAGHVNLSHILKGYMKMNELTSMYAKLKEIKQEVEKPAGEATDLHYSSPNECYKICPPPRPVNPINVVATPSPTSENPPNQICGYLAMNSTPQIKVDVQQKEQKFAPRTKCSQESINTSHSRATSPILQTTHKHHNNNSNNSSSNNNKPKTPDTFEDKVQEELREILNDCKNNVHSIAQTEKLVEQWKNRNDVQKSFKEKQEQLDQMRMEYEKIQQEMKRVHKTTPFERLKKLFGRNGSKQGKEDEASTPTTEVGSVSSNRPISSLSLQSTSSSGSSGRISTISGCSMGDSGTHSDHDDRKITTPIEEDFRSGLNKLLGMNNYHIPPSPKPIKMPNKYPVIEERPPQPTPRPETDQYYIHFPRSGKPIANNVIPEKPAEESEYLDLEGDSRKQSSKMTSSSSASQPLLYAEEYMNVPSKLPQVIQRNAENAPLYMNLHH